MLSQPERIEAKPRSKNGQPHHSTAGMASASLSHCSAWAGTNGRRSTPNTCAPMSRTTSASDKRHRHPKPAGEIDQLGIVHVLGQRAHRLERHAADRAIARSLLHDLRVHGAGVERAYRQGLRLTGFIEIAVGIGREFAAAAFGAEMICAPVVVVSRLTAMRIDRHAANGIGGEMRFGDGFFIHDFDGGFPDPSYKDCRKQKHQRNISLRGRGAMRTLGDHRGRKRCRGYDRAGRRLSDLGLADQLVHGRREPSRARR